MAAAGEFSTGSYVSEISGNLETDRLEKSVSAGIKETDPGVCVSEGYSLIFLEPPGPAGSSEERDESREKDSGDAPVEDTPFPSHFPGILTV